MMYSPRVMKLLRLVCIISMFLFIARLIAAQTGTFVQPKSKSRPLARGISDVQARIAKEQEEADHLQNAVSEHVLNIGKILYSTYGQEGDPAKKLIDLKNAYESVHSAVENGVTGQVWPAVGQFGQALLDFGSDPTFKWLSPQWRSAVNNINAFQQIGWEAARLKTTQSQLDGYQAQINTDNAIRQSLESESDKIAARQDSDNTDSTPETAPASTTDPILPVTPSGDFSALDDAILINKWLDLGNRAFTDQSQEDTFYSEFPAYMRFKNIAETQSPITDVEHAALPVGSRQSPDASEERWRQACAGTIPGSIIWGATGCDRCCSIGSKYKKQ